MTFSIHSGEKPVVPSTVPPAEGIRVLLDASAMLLATSSREAVVSGIVDLARQIIKADAYAVWRTFDARRWRVLASSGLSPSYRTELINANPNPPAFQAIPDVEKDALWNSFSETYRREGIRSLLVVPLQLSNAMPEGKNGATITFYWRTPHSFSDLDVSYASALANLSSAALNIAELHEQNQREKARLAFLADASALLASSLDYEDTLQRVARLAVPHIADWCTVHVVEHGELNRLVVAHADPAMLEFVQRYGERYPEVIREDRGLGWVLRTGQSEYIPAITEDMLSAAIADPEQLAMVRELNMSSSILVPLKSRGQVLGAIRLMATGERCLTREDVQLAEDLGRRAAAAIENAQLHRAVVEQDNRLRLAHSAARMGTWTWDLVNQRLTWSEEFRQLHGIQHSSASTVGQGPGLIHPEDREQVMKNFEEVLSSNADFVSAEHRAIAGDGRVFWVHSRGWIERDASGNPISIVGIVMDVTERRLAEETLRKTEKLAAAGRLAATVAHEINNPLESIVNLIYLCRNTPQLPEEASSFLKTADEELSRIAQIVRQTLGFYRESVDPRKCEVAAIVSESIALYRARFLAKSLTLDLELDSGLSAYLIPGELKQVMANLVANATDATAPGGRIRVSVKREGDAVAVVVADNGSGIDAENLPHLFEPFFTTKTDVGTGLGLWVTKGILEKQRGTIEVQSSTDPVTHGTAITVTLPLA